MSLASKTPSKPLAINNARGAPVAPMKRTKTYCVNGYAGCVALRKCRENGVTVGVYNNEQQGLDTSEPWSTVCEKHGHIINHQTLKLAMHHASNPLGWCEGCGAEAEIGGGAPVVDG
jgi:hypothetical protein